MLKSVLSKAVSYPEIVQQVDLVIGECTCTQLIQKASLRLSLRAAIKTPSSTFVYESLGFIISEYTGISIMGVAAICRWVYCKTCANTELFFGELFDISG